VYREWREGSGPLTARQPGFVVKVPKPDAIWPIRATLTRRMDVDIGEIIREIVVEPITESEPGQEPDPESMPAPAEREQAP